MVRPHCQKVARGLAARRYVQPLTSWYNVSRDVSDVSKVVLNTQGTKIWPGLIYLIFQDF